MQLKILVLCVALVVASFINTCYAAPATITPAEQEVIEALLQQDHYSKRYIIEEGISKYDRETAARIRKEAKALEPAAKEALEDFLNKNAKDTKLVFPTNTFKGVELISTKEAKKIFLGHNINDNWKSFYRRYPDSSGLITVSRVGIDPKGTVAIVYLERSFGSLGGYAAIRILKREGKKWILSKETVGPTAVS